MKNRLKENAMLIVLCIVIIICTVCLCNKMNETNSELGAIDFRITDGFNDIYMPLVNMESNLDAIFSDTSDMVVDIEEIRQDVDDIGYHFGI